ncbi:MAG: HDOD domain-containing protein [Steroidobacteraceae bacterium]
MSANEAPLEHALTGNEAFDFVKMLAAELSRGKVQLPSFPEVALRVQRVLANEEVNDNDLLRAVGAEPALAMRILQMANSVALNPMGRAVTELRSAIARIGHNMVSAAAVSFVIQQLRSSEELRHLKQPLQRLWLRSVSVGSLSMVVARRFTQVNPDTALLAGVLHGVGKLYILASASKHPRLLADSKTFDQIVRDWHASIARALLENWEICDEVLNAVHDFEDLDREMRGPIGLGDVLTVGNMLASFKEHHASSEEADAHMNRMGVDALRVWQRLRIDRDGCEAALEEAAEEIAALRHVLG